MIKLYKVNINEIAKADYISEYNLLCGITKQKIDSKALAEDKKRSLAGLILLRRAVFELYKIKEYNIGYKPSGKPVLDFCRFSVSHSGGIAVCAVSDSDIGIDTEKIRDIRLREHYKLFSENENIYVNSDPKNSSARFLEIWTKKESLAKLYDVSLNSSVCRDVMEKTDVVFENIPIDGYITTLCRPNGENGDIEFS